MIDKKRKVFAIIIAVICAFLFYLFFGIVTGIINNSFYSRMADISFYDNFFLIATSILSAINIGFYYYLKDMNDKCSYLFSGGIIAGLLSFGCALCNKILIIILGVAGVLTYFTPLQPILGLASLVLLLYSIAIQIRMYKSSKT